MQVDLANNFAGLVPVLPSTLLFRRRGVLLRRRECGGSTAPHPSPLRTPRQPDRRQLIEHNVKALLNGFAIGNFGTISDQIISYANSPEHESDGSALKRVTTLIWEKSVDDTASSEMYARLCYKVMERVSPNVQDKAIRDSVGQPIAGAMLFRKYLLNQCQEDLDRGWNAKEAAPAAAKSKANNDKAAEVASEANGEDVPYPDKHYAAKAKRQRLGLVRFIGELFKLSMLTERIMHECIKKLLSNVANPEEEEIESLCKLLTAVGQTLDNPKSCNHMDTYFKRMNEMAKGSNVNSRMQFMLLDVIELRSRHWQSRVSVPQPPPQRQDKGDHNVQRGGSRRGERRDTAEPDGWDVAGGASTRPPAHAGDLSQFGKISKSSTLQFGPTSVFSKEEPKREASMGRTSGTNMFAALGGGGDAPMPTPMERTPSSRRTSVDIRSSGIPTSEHKRLNLAPRTKPLEDKEEDKEEDKKKNKEEVPAPAALSEADAKKKVEEDIKKYLRAENVEGAIMALEALPTEYRHLFVDKLVSSALEGGNGVVRLAEKLFYVARRRSVISPKSFENGLLPTVEFADDISIDVPKLYEWLALFIDATGFDKSKVEELAGKIAVEGTPMVHPRDRLLKACEKWSGFVFGPTSVLSAKDPQFEETVPLTSGANLFVDLGGDGDAPTPMEHALGGLKLTVGHETDGAPDAVEQPKPLENREGGRVVEKGCMEKVTAPECPPQGYDPYMYWQHQHHPQHPRHPQPPQHPHPHPHLPPQIHTPPTQPSPYIQSARPPSTPPAPASSGAPTPSPGPLPPIITQTAHAATQPSAPSPSSDVTAAAFVPGAPLRRPIQIRTPNGDAVNFEGQVPPSPKVTVPVVPTHIKRPGSITIRIESEAQKEERLAKEKEEKEEKEREEEEARLKEEAERKEKEEAEAKAKAETEAAAKAKGATEARDKPSPLASPKVANGLLPTAPDRPSPLSTSTTAPDRPLLLCISTTLERPKRPVPELLDLSSAQGNLSAVPVSALASPRIIDDLSVVPYLESIKTPNPDLSIAATPGKFRYDREFLSQFMGVCKEKPNSFPPPDAIDLEPGEGGANYSASPCAGERHRVGSMDAGGAPSLSRQAPMGPSLGPGLAKGGGSAMGQFQSPPRGMDSQSRSDAPNNARDAISLASLAGSRLTSMTRSASQGGVGGGIDLGARTELEGEDRSSAQAHQPIASSEPKAQASSQIPAPVTGILKHLSSFVGTVTPEQPNAHDPHLWIEASGEQCERRGVGKTEGRNSDTHNRKAENTKGKRTRNWKKPGRKLKAVLSIGHSTPISTVSLIHAAGSASLGSKFTMTRETQPSDIIHYFEQDACVKNYTSDLVHSHPQEPKRHGGSADVYRVATTSGTLVAIKCLRVPLDAGDQMPQQHEHKSLKRTAKELEVWSTLKHKNILPLLGFAEYRGYVAMVSNWMSRGNVIDFINNRPEQDRYNLSTQIVEAVAYLHSREIVHGDIKGDNVLVSDDGIPMLTDFGLTMMIESKLVLSATNVGGGTMRWMAPELLVPPGGPRSKEADMYALGMTILETLTGQPPFAEIDNSLTIPIAVTTQRLTPRRPESLSTHSQLENTFWEIMTKCWAYEPTQRAKATEVEKSTSDALKSRGFCAGRVA